MLNVRRLAALDLYGTTGSARRRRIVRAEFIVGAAGCTLLGVVTLMSASGWGIVLGAWLVTTGLNYLPLAVSAQSLSRPGALEAELAGADLPRELRQSGTRQLWILVPLAVVTAAVAQAWSRQPPSVKDGDDAPAAP